MSVFFNIIYFKNHNPFWEELPKYIMLYLDMAYENKYFFHINFSRKLEALSIIKIKIMTFHADNNYCSLILSTCFFFKKLVKC